MSSIKKYTFMYTVTPPTYEQVRFQKFYMYVVYYI